MFLPIEVKKNFRAVVGAGPYIPFDKQSFIENAPAGKAGAFCTTRVCKPGSVIDSHLSKPAIAHRLQPPPRSGRANHILLHGVAPDRVYIVKPISLWAGCALTAPFHPCCPYESYRQRYISVALVLGSPPAGVTRYPCPMEPGLSSPGTRWDPGRDCPTRSQGLFYCNKVPLSNENLNLPKA